MKKILIKLFICTMCFGLVACGSGKPEGVSDDAYDLGVKAVEVAQQYLDGDIDAKELEKKLNKFTSQITVTGKGNNNATLNYKIVLIISAAIVDESESKVLEAKNDLKSYLGM